MAATKKNQTSKLIIRVESGVNSSGAAVYSQRTFTHINPALSDDDVLNIGKVLGALQKYPVDSVNRQDAAALAEA